jgi:putative acetyltransferase
VEIREETESDCEAVRQVNRQAFGGEAESELVDDLRRDGLVVASLVAIDTGLPVGHILFSELSVVSDDVIPSVALAPMAVVPVHQRQGVGATLVRRGLELCRDRGKDLVVVVGHPDYYPRFGFSADLAKSLRSEYSSAGDAFMALELRPGVLNGRTADVRYPDAFRNVE